MDAVVFDLFGTLIPNLSPDDLRAGLTDLADLFGAEADAFCHEWSRGFVDRMDGTVSDGPGVFDPVLQALGIDASDATRREADRRRVEWFAARIAPKPDAVATLDALRDRGCRLALATDCSSGTPELLDRGPLGAYFAVRAISAELRTRKPDALMYQKVLDGLDVAPDRCLYVGDGNSDELPGAKRMGMTPVWVDNGAAQHWHDRWSAEADHTVRELSELPSLVDRLRGDPDAVRVAEADA